MSHGVDGDTEHEPTAVDHSPTKFSTVAAVAAAVVAGLTSAPYSVLALPLGIVGVGSLVAGLVVAESRTWVTLGAGSLLLCVLVSGGFGTPAELLLLSTVSTVLAWDLGRYAIGLGEQVGRHSRTRRNEVSHAAFSTIVGVVATAIGYGFYVTAGGGRPIAALSMLLVGVVFVLWAIRT